MLNQSEDATTTSEGGSSSRSFSQDPKNQVPLVSLSATGFLQLSALIVDQSCIKTVARCIKGLLTASGAFSVGHVVVLSCYDTGISYCPSGLFAKDIFRRKGGILSQ
jgi:hypothetical protein